MPFLGKVSSHINLLALSLSQYKLHTFLPLVNPVTSYYIYCTAFWKNLTAPYLRGTSVSNLKN